MDSSLGGYGNVLGETTRASSDVIRKKEDGSIFIELFFGAAEKVVKIKSIIGIQNPKLLIFSFFYKKMLL